MMMMVGQTLQTVVQATIVETKMRTGVSNSTMYMAIRLSHVKTYMVHQVYLT